MARFFEPAEEIGAEVYLEHKSRHRPLKLSGGLKKKHSGKGIPNMSLRKKKKLFGVREGWDGKLFGHRLIPGFFLKRRVMPEDY